MGKKSVVTWHNWTKKNLYSQPLEPWLVRLWFSATQRTGARSAIGRAVDEVNFCLLLSSVARAGLFKWLFWLLPGACLNHVRTSFRHYTSLYVTDTSLLMSKLHPSYSYITFNIINSFVSLLCVYAGLSVCF